MTTIDEYSLATVPIEQLFNDTSLGNATGFVWKSAGKHFLITNWHVVTCRRFPPGENLRDDGGRPNKLRLLFNLRTYTFGKQQWDIPIRDGDNLWLVHVARGAVAEVVGIEGGVVSGVFNLESSGVRASDWRPRHDERYHEA